MSDESNNEFYEMPGFKNTQDSNISADKSFVDLYDLLGIPPGSSANLIYLAMVKLENNFNNKSSNLTKQEKYEMKELISLIQEELLNASNRVVYEKNWEAYYFPLSETQETDVESSISRNINSKLLQNGLKYKSCPFLVDEEKELSDNFDYQNDFNYLIMRDQEKGRDTFFLNPSTPLLLSSAQDKIFFEDRQFYLQSKGTMEVTIINDALGKNIILKQKDNTIPLHIGDRLELEDGTRLILRGFYTKKPLSLLSTPSTSLSKSSMYFHQEKTIISLDESQIYIVGRNTSDIRSLPLEKDVFTFVNVGRRERSISRQNFLMFYRENKWFLQDLGSRYGTTLNYDKHTKMETLVGGSIMALEPGEIRLGYDKSYVIQFGENEEIKSLKEKSIEEAKNILSKNNASTSIYDLALL